MNEYETQNFIVTDIQMPFMSMVFFIVKWIITLIPAMLILAMLGALMAGIFGSIG